jgi:Holliday junction resolvase-like predicted endonuclease
MQKTISGEIDSILNQNKMSSIINEVKKIMSRYNTHDMSLINKLQKRDDVRMLAVINVLMHSSNRTKSLNKFCMYYDVYSEYASTRLNSTEINALLSSSIKEDFQKILLISQVSNINTVDFDLDTVANPQMLTDKNIKKLAML